MNALILEENERISKIFSKICNEKGINADIVKESDFITTFGNKIKNGITYDCVILEESKSTESDKRLEDKLLDINPKQKIFFLSPYMKIDENVPKTTQMIIQKPFALITLLSKLDLTNSAKIIVNTISRT